MSVRLWLAFKYLRNAQAIFNLTTWLGLLGLSFGVAALVVAMAVVSGFESTLTKNVTDMVGHLIIEKRGQMTSQEAPWFHDILPLIDGFEAKTPFARAEGIIAGVQKVAGVLIEGVDPVSFEKVMSVRDRLVEGKFIIDPVDGVAGALMGRNLVKKFGLKVGDQFKVVTPVESQGNQQSFKSRQIKMRLNGVLELGRHDYNERYILTNLETVQDFAELGNKVMGFRVRIKDHKLAETIRDNINREKSMEVYVADYHRVNANLFKAVEIEKVVIFFVLLIIVIAAGFNISISLFVSVVRRYRDIAILKTMGASRRFVLLVFSLQGLLLGVAGAFIGVSFGLLLCQLFMWAQVTWQLIPSEIYRISRLDVEVRLVDVSVIVAVTLLICLVSSLAPALRGSRLKPVEGLKYE